MSLSNQKCTFIKLFAELAIVRKERRTKNEK